MKKKKKMPKVVMAASVAAMGMGLFSTLENEARATGGDKVCYYTITTSPGHQVRYCGTCSFVEDSAASWISGKGTC